MDLIKKYFNTKEEHELEIRRSESYRPLKALQMADSETTDQDGTVENDDSKTGEEANFMKLRRMATSFKVSLDKLLKEEWLKGTKYEDEDEDMDGFECGFESDEEEEKKVSQPKSKKGTKMNDRSQFIVYNAFNILL